MQGGEKRREETEMGGEIIIKCKFYKGVVRHVGLEDILTHVGNCHSCLHQLTQTCSSVHTSYI